jgi:hypothetical protein
VNDRLTVPTTGPVTVALCWKLPSPFGVVLRSATRVCPFGPVAVAWLLQPEPDVQLLLRVEVPPRGPLTVRVRLTVPLEAVIEPERDQVLPDFVVVDTLFVQVPPEQPRLKVRVAPRPPDVSNDRVPDSWPGVRLTLALCDQPGR